MACATPVVTLPDSRGAQLALGGRERVVSSAERSHGSRLGAKADDYAAGWHGGNGESWE
jgi:hypothetical protein